MPVTINGQVSNNPSVNVGNTNELVNTITVVDSAGTATVVYTRVVARDFTQADAMVAFAVAEDGTATFSLLEGTFVSNSLRISGTTGIVSSGQNIGAVTVDETRALTGRITVPNNPTIWSNAGQEITFSVITIQDAVDQMAAWIRTQQGSLTGGTPGTEVCGMFGEWTGVGVTDINVPASGEATARCGTTSEMCSISRDQTCTTTYTNAQRVDDYTCSITQQGEGSSSCAEISSLGLPTGVLGDMEMVTVTGLTRQTSRINTQTRQVRNLDFVPAAGEFSLADLMITANATDIPSAGLGVNVNALQYVDIGSHASSVTSLTVRASISQNMLTSDRTVTLSFYVEGTVPSGFQDPGSSFIFDTGSVQKIQAGQVLVDATSLSLSPNSADIFPGTPVSDTVNVQSVSPTTGRWHVTTGATALITLAGATGSGNGSFTWRYNGGNVARDIDIQVRSGHTIGGGSLLATFNLIIA